MGATTRDPDVNNPVESGTPPCQRTPAVWGARAEGSSSLFLRSVVLVFHRSEDTAREHLARLALRVVVEDERVTDDRVVAVELHRDVAVDGARCALRDREVDGAFLRLAGLRAVRAAVLRLV